MCLATEQPATNSTTMFFNVAIKANVLLRKFE